MIAHPDGGRAARAAARRLCAGDGPEPEPAVAEALAERVPHVEETLASLDWRWVALGDTGFPPLLARVSDPPLGVFVRGELPAGHAVALVGARRATAYGREVGEYLARELALAGVTVVSGMARGVDAAAHRGAVAAGGTTVAVWGAGPDRIYPAEHAGLADEIAAHGCLLTEYPPGSPPVAHHFPERNRIIAGLAEAVVVVEADERSGALITARLALDEGRDVLAVPGSVFSRLSAGPNGLLRAGAAPVLSADDVLAALGLAPRAATPSTAGAGLSDLIPAGEAVSVDRLAAASGKPVAEVLEALLVLELSGKVAREADGRYRRCHVRT